VVADLDADRRETISEVELESGLLEAARIAARALAAD
jgi:hypothetical protein